MEPDEDGPVWPYGPRVEYTGTANVRRIYIRDLRADPEYAADEYLSWDESNKKALPWGYFVSACGDGERAAAFLAANAFEFMAFDLDVELPESEEFSIGGPVGD